MRAVLVIALLSLSTIAAECQERLSPLEAALVNEINRIRQDPRGYAIILANHKQYYHGDVLAFPGAPRVRTQEGVEALDEAIRDLALMDPVLPLSVSAGLCQAARDHVKDQGSRGAVGHRGADQSDPSIRASRYSRAATRVGENIINGEASNSSWILLRFLVDDGIAGRAHRKNLLDASYRFVGVSCGPHTDYDGICVLDFARQYSDRVALTVVQ
jgi:uncharacterized protein YkwD